MKERFGPEYDRTIEAADGRRQAEAELAAREERREQLSIRPLPEGARERYSAEWNEVQAGFVDAPDDAVRQADDLVSQVMSDRGYPMDDFDQRASDISVDHPMVVENYRAARRVYASVKRGNATTEEERMAMRHYRSLFDRASRRDRLEHERKDGDDPWLTRKKGSLRADLAAGGGSAPGRSPTRRVATTVPPGRSCLTDEAGRYDEQWRSVQGGFVDHPRQAVEEADRLVADLMQRLATEFSETRAGLERQWESAADVSTEDLRVAMTRYRSFFERLLAT